MLCLLYGLVVVVIDIVVVVLLSCWNGVGASGRLGLVRPRQRAEMSRLFVSAFCCIH